MLSQPWRKGLFLGVTPSPSLVSLALRSIYVQRLLVLTIFIFIPCFLKRVTYPNATRDAEMQSVVFFLHQQQCLLVWNEQLGGESMTSRVPFKKWALRLKIPIARRERANSEVRAFGGDQERQMVEKVHYILSLTHTPEMYKPSTDDDSQKL